MIDYSISVQGTLLYIGGNFTLSVPSPDDSESSLLFVNIAKYDLVERKWREIESIMGFIYLLVNADSRSPELSAVYSITHDDENVYAFGLFDQAGGLQVEPIVYS